MAFIAKSKFGRCSICGTDNINIVKVGKTFYCISKCYRELKGQQQISKAIERDRIRREATKSTKQNQKTAVRSLNRYECNIGIVKDSIGDKVKQAEMDLFWLTAQREIDKKPQCWECGAFIPKSFYRAATAHVLPKRKDYGFPSIAGNLNNYLILGAGCGCHARYDRSWEDAAQMKIFPIAIEKFKILSSLIANIERKNIPEILRQEIL